MILFLKFILIIVAIAFSLSGYYIIKMFVDSFKTEEYEQSSLMGKLTSKLLFGSILVTFSSFIILDFILIFSSISIK